MDKKISIVQISTDTNKGGAGKAAYRLNNSLNKSRDCKSIIYTSQNKNNSNLDINEYKIRTYTRKIITKFFRIIFNANNIFKNNLTSFSLIKIPFLKSIPDNFDIYNLHWIQHEFFSIYDINKLTNNKIVWTLHDCWPISGIFHYDPIFVSKKTNNFFKLLLWLDNYLLKKKLQTIKKKNIYFVAPSNWIKQEAINSTSKFLKPKIEVIPNPVPSLFFKEINKTSARSELNLPLDKKIVFFSSIGGLKDLRKGGYLLIEAIKDINNSVNDIFFIMVGEYKTSNDEFNLNNIRKFGLVKNDYFLLKIYKACDLVVIPSLIDNLPQVGTEAQACGRPVVAFNEGGLRDIVDNKNTGILINQKSSYDLSKGIQECLNSNLIKEEYSQKIRERAQKIWSEQSVNKKYIKLYKKISKDRS